MPKVYNTCTIKNNLPQHIKVDAELADTHVNGDPIHQVILVTASLPDIVFSSVYCQVFFFDLWALSE